MPSAPSAQRLTASGQGAPAGEPLVEVAELRVAGQIAGPEEVGDLLEGAVRDLVDQVAAPVDEPPVLAVDLADLGLGGDDAFQSWAVRDGHRTTVYELLKPDDRGYRYTSFNNQLSDGQRREEA